MDEAQARDCEVLSQTEPKFERAALVLAVTAANAGSFDRTRVIQDETLLTGPDSLVSGSGASLDVKPLSPWGTLDDKPRPTRETRPQAEDLRPAPSPVYDCAGSVWAVSETVTGAG